MLRIRFTNVDTVIATVALSSVATAFCGMVIAANVQDAVRSILTASPAPETIERVAERPAPIAAAERRYPVAAASINLTTPLGFNDTRPNLAAAPSHDTGELLLARLPEVYGPLSTETREALAPTALASFRAPFARPDRFADLPALNTAPAATPSPLLVNISPRPVSRPTTLLALARTPEAVDNIQVARAEAPDASLTPVRLSEDPDQARLFPPRVGRSTCGSRLARDIPRRSGNAAPASALLASLGNGSGSGRDNALVAEAMSGNVPDHIRALQPVRFTGTVGGRETEIVICVTPDYLAVGSNSDHVRVPLGLPAALRVADAFDMVLPTTRMVDAIYAQAGLRLPPRPMSPGPQMSSTDYFMRHDATLDAQLVSAGASNRVLIAGHKKDLVLANRLSSNRGRVAIYGWHRSNGDPIQPLSTVHGEYYADYSHGIRLVSRTAYVNGRPVDIRSLLTDSSYAGMLNSDGPLSSATIQLAAL